jgi:lysophospholipase L1-like esterase
MAFPQSPAQAIMTASRPRRTCALALCAALLAASVARPAAAQDDPQAPIPLAPSMECRVPGSQLYTTAMLAASKAALDERHTLKILAIGGSSAPGASASYPVKLEAALEQAMPRVDVVIEHRGLSGEIASGAAERLRSLVADADPDLVVWQVGTHDAIARVDPAAFAEALEDSVAWLKSHGIDVVLVDPLYTASVAADSDYNRIVEGVRDVATRLGVPLVRRFEALRYLAGRTEKGEGHILGRQFRLNDLGLRCMAEHVALTISASLARTPATAPTEAKPALPPTSGTPEPGPVVPPPPAQSGPHPAPG